MSGAKTGVLASRVAARSNDPANSTLTKGSDEMLTAVIVALSFAQVVVPPEPYFPSTFKGQVDVFSTVLTAAGVIVAGFWAVTTFQYGNKIKAAELLVKQEESYMRDALPTLLALEYTPDYNAKYKLAIERANAAHESGSSSQEGYSADESKAIDNLEKMLRHFLTSAFISGKKIDHGLMDEAYAYYLRFFRQPDRTELADYIRYYWPTVYVWTETHSKSGRSRSDAKAACRARLRAESAERSKRLGLVPEKPRRNKRLQTSR
jgi:hypothetical protein